MTDNGATPSEPAGRTSEEVTSSHPGLPGAALNLALAGIGLAGLLGDRAMALYRRSLEHGQSDVQKVRERLGLPERLSDAGPARDMSKAGGKRSRIRAENILQNSEEWRMVLARLHMPTAEEVRALTAQVADLEAKIESLRQQR